MKAAYSYLTAATIMLAFFSACAREIIIETAQDGVFATWRNPECGDLENSKALTSDFKFSFTEGDQINVFPKNGGNEAMTYGLIPDATDQSKAAFASSIFSMTDGTYTSVFPSQNVPKDITSISLPFTGQTQSENGSTAHLSDYDYSWAEAQIISNSGTFSFAHKVSWLKITINVQEAANFKSLSVLADEGIAQSAIINAKTGQVTTSRSQGDILTLSLGDSKGISVGENQSLTAFVTIPSDTYTHIAVCATDADGNIYQYTSSKQATLVAGKYYSMTVGKSTAKSFKNITVYGAYSNTALVPEEIIAYNEEAQQMSCGSGAGFKTFKLADAEKNVYAIFTVSAASIAEGETYTVSASIKGEEADLIQNNGVFKAVKKTANCVWLENSDTNIGYILATE